MQKKLVCLLIWMFLLGTASANTKTTIRVNIGGPAYTDSKGQAWSADFGFNSGNASGCAPKSTVTGTSDPFLFKSARVSRTIDPELQYTFRVPNGSYIVNLYFAEPCYSVIGDRVFDVQLQGAPVFSAVDIVKIAGPNHALIESATVSVKRRQLTIRFVHHNDNPILAAIEIVPATAATMPAIRRQPSSTTVNAGQPAAFSVTATGTAPLSYQWQRGGAAISGATSSAYTTAATTNADSSAQFRVVVSNSKGSATSSTATLTVNATVVAPTISSQPSSQTVTTGQTATFSVAATGTAPLSYQWQRGGVAISGATSPAYTTAATTSADKGAQFLVVVSNSKGSATSSTATLTVNAAVVAPTISSQPSSQTVTTGQTATFSVAATGTAPLSYQWQRGGVAISGATSSAYTTAATTSADEGAQFLVVVSNSKGTATSNIATLTVNAAVAAPTISSQPSSQTVTTGQTATFSVTASGTAPLSYQWQRGGVAISGATNSLYTTPTTTSSDNSAQFRVLVSNSKGTATSNIATLTVNPAVVAPTISSQPSSQTVTAGQTATFSVTASGTAPLTYQWQRGGVAISGATNSAYTTSAATSGDNSAQFRVLVSNSKDTVTSNTATLTVNAAMVAPTISSQPSSQTVTTGQTATFSVTASGTAPLSYQWQKNDSIVNGATSSTYTTPATTSADNGARFAVGVSNAAGSVTSNDATLSVSAPSAAVDVITYHNDNGRTGQNLKETTLTLSNVNQNTFGLRKIVTLDGKVDAQPLFLSGVSIAGGTHDVVYVVTEHDSVYALDSATGAVLWHVSTLSNGETTSDTHGCGQVSPEMGITSTPVIDRMRGPNGAIYVVAMSKNSGGAYFQRLYALDVTTGAQLFGGPHTISATYPGTGDHSSGGNVIFDPGQYKERAGLLMIGGNIYTTWASHCDFRPYTGWIMSFNADSLAAVSVLNITPNGNEGAMWMSGAAPAADSSGNIFLLDGNGTMDTTLNGSGFPAKGDFGNCFCKISTSGGLQVADYFAMSNTVSESNADTDLGSGAALVLPDLSDGSGNTLHLAVGAGKDGNIYVVNRDNMGKFDPNSNHIYQQLDRRNHRRVVDGRLFQQHRLLCNE